MPPLRRPNRTGKDRESEPVLSDREVWTVKIRAGALVVFILPAVPLVSQTVCSVILSCQFCFVHRFNSRHRPLDFNKSACNVWVLI